MQQGAAGLGAGALPAKTCALREECTKSRAAREAEISNSLSFWAGAKHRGLNSAAVHCCWSCTDASWGAQHCLTCCLGAGAGEGGARLPPEQPAPRQGGGGWADGRVRV